MNLVDHGGNVPGMAMVCLYGASGSSNATSRSVKESSVITYLFQSDSGAISCLYDTSTKTIKIMNSFLINDRKEKYCILNMINSHFGFGWNNKKIEELYIEWSAHNFIYDICTTPIASVEQTFVNGVPSEVMVPKYYIYDDIIGWFLEDPKGRARHVDFYVDDRSDSYQSYYDFVTVGGLISW